MSGVWRPVVRLPLQRSDLRRMQRILPEEYHQERSVSMQVWQQLRNRYVHEAEMPRVSIKKMPNRRHEARM